MKLEELKKNLQLVNVEEKSLSELLRVLESIRNCQLILANSAQVIGSYKIAGTLDCDLCSEVEEAQNLLRELIYKQSGIYRDFARRLDKEVFRKLGIAEVYSDVTKEISRRLNNIESN
ncbi:hypothetical protein PORUE0001_1943 [Porphyromonas uenonis 60-3]|uniref:Uncharacterized protein n=1 Tax=Porphyromonas uenonis 60-3 TaxID=596327 RepID=C2MEK6_9PORP|nr:hypothetical protein [Porphyromonas uenonis]EEK15865.1 hypothetical protein PORUE0001_1943 [Porphyromonas uenonis 60-3]